MRSFLDALRSAVDGAEELCAPSSELVKPAHDGSLCLRKRRALLWLERETAWRTTAPCDLCTALGRFGGFSEGEDPSRQSPLRDGDGVGTSWCFG
ncbi:MAG: hypothetical protein C4334_06600 [Pyrinomonas sp.]